MAFLIPEPPPPTTEPITAPSSSPPPNPSPLLPPPKPPSTPISAAVVAIVPASATTSAATIDVLADTGIIQYGTMLSVASSSTELSCKCLCNKPLSIMSCTLANISSWLCIFNGSIVCFCMLFHPDEPRDMLLPQYSHVITISPNLGDIGAPQLGHLREVAFVGASTSSLLEV